PSTRKSAETMCEHSSAQSKLSAILRKSFIVIAIFLCSLVRTIEALHTSQRQTSAASHAILPRGGREMNLTSPHKSRFLVMFICVLCVFDLPNRRGAHPCAQTSVVSAAPTQIRLSLTTTKNKFWAGEADVLKLDITNAGKVPVL